MALQYHDLDAKTRQHMVAEIDADHGTGSLYISQRLNQNGIDGWYALLREASSAHDDAWLAMEIQRRGFLKSHEERRKPKGGVTIAQVPINAHETLAEGEFNRFYARGLCLRAIQDSVAQVVAYRARYSDNPRLESERIIGKAFNPTLLLNDLRTSSGVEPALGVPPGPNSGISVRLP